MSLEHILLGMLNRPASGFDLRSEFQNGARFFWSAELSQIYSTLRRMEKKGWLQSRTQPSPKGPDRRVYERTLLGLDELRDWLLSGPSTGNERFAYIGQLIFMGELNDLSVTLEFLMALREELTAMKQILVNASEGAPSFGNAPSTVDGNRSRDFKSTCASTFKYDLPSLALLDESTLSTVTDVDVKQTAKGIEETFEAFELNASIANIEKEGPAVIRYEVKLEKGLRVSKLHNIEDDFALRLGVPNIRIDGRIPGKNTVGIEVPRPSGTLVRLKDLIPSPTGEPSQENGANGIPLFLGQDVTGGNIVVDLCKLPHLLICGRNGSGKNMCLDAIMASILMSCRADEVRFVLIDPEIVGMNAFRDLPHLMSPVVTDPAHGEANLSWAVGEMERRYGLLKEAGVRNLSSYNEWRETLPTADRDAGARERLSHIVIMISELADLMATSGKQVEQHIVRLAAKSRAVGIHLVLATQKPTVDVVTGLIKANIPARIAFQVGSRSDSRVILDQPGAEKLLANGDMLFLQPATSSLVRIQGTHLADDELKRIVAASCQGEPSYHPDLLALLEHKDEDSLYHDAIDLTLTEGRASISMLQRKLGVGYGRAARWFDRMENEALIGPYNGNKAREVRVTKEQWNKRRERTTQIDSCTGDTSDCELVNAEMDLPTFHSHLGLAMGVMSLTAKLSWCDQAIAVVQARLEKESTAEVA